MNNLLIERKAKFLFSSSYPLRFQYLICIAILFLSFCNRTTLSLTKDNVENPSYVSKTESYLLGYYEFGAVEEWICPSDSHTKIVIERNIVDSVIHFAVGGVFTTRSNIVYCSKSIEARPTELQPNSSGKTKSR